MGPKGGVLVLITRDSSTFISLMDGKERIHAILDSMPDWKLWYDEGDVESGYVMRMI